MSSRAITKTLVRSTVAAALIAVSLVATPGGSSAEAAPPTLTPVQQIPAQANGFAKPWPVSQSGHAKLYGWGAATLLDGTVAIGDYWNYLVARFQPDGTELPNIQTATVGPGQPGWGPKPGQHQGPYGLAVDPVSGNLFVADTDRYKIDIYTPTAGGGTYVESFGTHGDSTGQTNVAPKFMYPSRVAVGKDGRVYVADTWTNRIVIVKKVNGVWTQLGEIKDFGTTLGKFKQPHGISMWYAGTATTADDLLFITNTDTQRPTVLVFSADGVFKTEIGRVKGTSCSTSQPPQFGGDLRGLAVDQTNQFVYVVDAAGNRIHKFDFAVSGSTVTLSMNQATPCFGQGVDQAHDGTPAPLGFFSDGGRELTVDLDGNVWVGDMPNFRVQKFSPTGTPLFQRPAPADPAWRPPLGAFNGPRGVAVDAAGSVFVTDTYNQRIQRRDGGSGVWTAWGSRGRDPGGFALNYSRMLAVDPRPSDHPSGNGQSVVVADTDNNSIKRFSNDGTTLLCQTPGSAQGRAVGQYRNPHGVDVAPDGRIFVADSRNNRVQVLDQNCANPTVLGTTTAMLFPRGIAFDPADSSVWVGDSGKNAVFHFNGSTGALLGTIPNVSNAFDVEVFGPYVFVAASDSNTIRVFDRNTLALLLTYGGGGKGPGKFQQPQGLDLVTVGARTFLYVTEQKNERVQVLEIS